MAPATVFAFGFFCPFMVHFPSVWVSKPGLISRDEYPVCESIAESCCARLLYICGNSKTEKLRANAGFKTSALPLEAQPAPERPQAILGPPVSPIKTYACCSLLKAQFVSLGGKIKTEHYPQNPPRESFGKTTRLSGRESDACMEGKAGLTFDK